MQAAEFQERLRRCGCYETPQTVSRTPADRLFGGLGAWYYGRLFRTVLRCARVCRRGPLDVPAWSGFAVEIMHSVECVGGRIWIAGFKPVADLPSPVVYVANHMSLLETFAIPAMALSRGRHLTIVLKESLLRYPVFGHIMKGIRPVAVTRRNAREDLRRTLDGSRRALARGDDVLIFPQSTRSPRVNPADFNSLGIKVARRAGVPVVPLALKTDFHGVGRLLRDFGRVDRRKPVCFRFGAPIRVAGAGRAEHRQVVDFITGALREWGVSVEAAPAAGLESRQAPPGGGE